jgi:N-methylhydantoinase A
LISGPVGGVMGARYIGSITGMDNIIVTDLGGTSFDIGAITRGYVPVDPEPVVARFKLNLPTLAVESIGAGSGSYVLVDPVTKKIQIGPDGAGSVPGPVCFRKGGKCLTITDCDLVLGYLNPDNFLGGRQKLDRASFGGVGGAGHGPDRRGSVYRCGGDRANDGARGSGRAQDGSLGARP